MIASGPIYRARRQTGIGIIELMVASAIGLLLIAAVVGLTVNSSSAYRAQIDHARNNENARVAVTLIHRDLLMAGHFGCMATMDGFTNNLNVADGDLRDAGALRGFEGLDNMMATEEFLPSGFDATPLNILPGTDAITVRFADPERFADLASEVVTATSEVTADPMGEDFEPGHLVVISDCENGDVFQVSGENGANVLQHAGTGTPGNNGNALGTTYLEEGRTRVYRLEGSRYYVRLRDPADQDSHALYRSSIASTGGIVNQEIVEGIANLQLLYGVDADDDGDPDSYAPATSLDAATWSDVVSIQVGVLAVDRSDAAPPGGCRVRSLLDEDDVTIFNRYAPHRCSVYTSTIFLRNLTRNLS